MDDQQRLRYSCDSIASVHEEELVDAYMAEKEVPYKKKVCKKYCKKVGMFSAFPSYSRCVCGCVTAYVCHSRVFDFGASVCACVGLPVMLYRPRCCMH